MLIGNLKITRIGWHNWRWCLRWPVERHPEWMRGSRTRNGIRDGVRVLFWDFALLEECSC